MKIRLTFPTVHGVRIIRAHLDDGSWTVGTCRHDRDGWRADLWRHFIKTGDDWRAATVTASTLTGLRVSVRDRLRKQGKWWT